MEKKTEILKGADELHLKDVGVFFIKGKKAFYADGRPVEPGKLFVCQYCTNSPPFVSPKEIDFVKHMIDKHPEHAKPKPGDRRPQTQSDAFAGPAIKKAPKKTTKK